MGKALTVSDVLAFLRAQAIQDPQGVTPSKILGLSSEGDRNAITSKHKVPKLYLSKEADLDTPVPGHEVYQSRSSSR